MQIRPTKAVILAGGLGTRISEETGSRPKPMVEIGGRPIIWHIMKIYSHYGINKFIVCLGYKGYVIKEYFQNYFLHTSDVTIDLTLNNTKVHTRRAEPWEITLVETGESTMTGGRLKRVRDYIKNETFCMTYGDGVSDLDIGAEIDFHLKHGKDATMAAIRPSSRFGAAEIINGEVKKFREKPEGETGWINAGFFILSPKVLDLIDDDTTIWERGPMEQLAAVGQMMAYRHDGFWQAMDTLRDKQHLEDLWSKKNPPWVKWD
jgi:glucose-1-phosphate cytidylyltransferase